MTRIFILLVLFLFGCLLVECGMDVFFEENPDFVFDELDINRSHSLEIPELLPLFAQDSRFKRTIVSQRPSIRRLKAAMKKTLKLFDKNNNGRLEEPEFERYYYSEYYQSPLTI